MGTRCPACKNSPQLWEIRYNEPFPCRYCGLELLVAPNYLRLVYYLTMPLTVELLLMIGIRGCVFWILLFPTNITLFNFVLGALAWLWVPPLVRSDDYEYVTTLKLATPREVRYGREITNHGSCGS